MAPAAAVSRGLVAAVMQTGGLLKDLTVRETVRLTASLYAEPRPVDEVLERAGITGIADRLVGKCSGGEQQRLRFALALLPDPALMALDEPTAGMDVEGRRDFWSAIRRDAEQGRTVLFATHYLEEADAYADRIILLRQGRIVADGTAAEVRNLSSGRSVRASLAERRPGDPLGSARCPFGRDPRRPGAHPDDGFRCGGAVPVDVDRGARRGDRGPQPRGRVPRPHLGRAGGAATTVPDERSAA